MKLQLNLPWSTTMTRSVVDYRRSIKDHSAALPNHHYLHQELASHFQDHQHKSQLACLNNSKLFNLTRQLRSTNSSTTFAVPFYQFNLDIISFYAEVNLPTMGFHIFLENRWKNKLHVFMLMLVFAVMGLAGARMVMITGQRTRSDSMALAMVRSPRHSLSILLHSHLSYPSVPLFPLSSAWD